MARIIIIEDQSFDGPRIVEEELPNRNTGPAVYENFQQAIDAANDIHRLKLSFYPDLQMIVLDLDDLTAFGSDSIAFKK